jgi:glutamine cyclotransferase
VWSKTYKNKEKKANIYHSDMDKDRVQTYRRVASTMFNDGVINMGRVLVLFAFTSQMGQQYLTDAWKFWDIHDLKGHNTNTSIDRSFTNQNRGKKPIRKLHFINN